MATGEDLLTAVAALALPVVGRSHLGRPIHAGPVGGGADGPVLVIGGVHGDEPASVAAVVDLALVLAGAPPRRYAVWVLPVLNPDGLVPGTKNSARDVDLNRNFPARNFTAEHAAGYHPGIAPLSEPETRVLARLVAEVAPRAVLAVHAPLACVNYDGPAMAWAEAVARAGGWPVRADIGYPTPGSLGSWLGVDRGLPVLTLELPPGRYDGFRGSARAALLAAVNLPGIG